MVYSLLKTILHFFKIELNVYLLYDEVIPLLDLFPLFSYAILSHFKLLAKIYVPMKTFLTNNLP